MNQIKIALFMTMNQVMAKYSGIMNLIRELIDNPNFDFKFLYTHNVPDSVKEFLKNYEEISIPYSCSMVTKDNNTFDYVITIDPYYGPHCKGSGYKNWTTKIIYKEYGITGLDGSTYLYNSGVCKKAWRIITDTEETRLKMSEVTGRDLDTFIVGNPAFDYDQYTVKSSEDHKTIIWSPHGSIIENSNTYNIIGGRYSTFLTYKDAFLREIPNAFKDVNFIYKLHPVLGFRIEEAKRLGEVDSSFNYEQWQQEAASNDNVVIADDKPYYDLFMNSSLMLCDSISFMAEYLPTHNPIIVLRDETSSRFSDYAEALISSSYYEALSVEQIIERIQQILNEDDQRKQESRQMYLKKYKPYTKSNSEYIIDYLINERNTP